MGITYSENKEKNEIRVMFDGLDEVKNFSKNWLNEELSGDIISEYTKILERGNKIEYRFDKVEFTNILKELKSKKENKNGES